MYILVTGLSHKNTPIEIREKVVFPEDQINDALEELICNKSIHEAVIISTCNRTEVYIICDELEEGKKDLVTFISQYHSFEQDQLEKYLYFHEGRNAVHHLFTVASSLDSMVVGEAQILGQVKEAYMHAHKLDATNIIFNRLFRHAFRVGKRVRTETGIGESAVSISYAAVELAKKVFEKLENRTVMVLGAGEMSELTTKHLVANGVSMVLVSNRTYNRAVDLANSFNGKAVKFERLEEFLIDVDIVISSTAAPHFVVERKKLTGIMHKRKHRPIFFIDIAVPRDIDPEVNKIYNVYLYDIDDLEKVVEANLQERMSEANKAEKILHHEIKDFLKWLGSLEVAPAITELKSKIEQVRKEEVEKTLRKINNLSEKDKNYIMAMSKVIINKVLHDPIVRAKASTNQKGGYRHVDSFRYLFDIEEGDQ